MADYSLLEWQDSPSTATPVNAANLNHMDMGIYTAQHAADQAKAAADVALDLHGGNVLIVTSLEDIPEATPAGTLIAISNVTPPDPEDPEEPEIPTGVYALASAAGDKSTYGNQLSTTATLNSPANAAVGDLLVCIVAAQFQPPGGGDFTWTKPAGWTEFAHTTTGRQAAMFYYPIPNSGALSSLPSTHAFAFANTASRVAAVMFRVRGADLAAPSQGSTGTSTGTTTSVNLSSFSTAASGAVIGFATSNSASGGGNPVATPPAGTDTLMTTYVASSSGSSTGLFAFFKQVSGETAHGASSIAFSPAAAANIYGMQTAIKAA